MSVTVDDISIKLKDIHEAVSKIPSHLAYLEKEIKLCDQETQDILHKIELSNFNAQEGWKLCKDLQITRQSRRKAKDELKGLSEIHKRLTRKSLFTVHAESSLRDISKHLENLNNRTYKTKVRHDWGAHFEKEEAVK